MNIQDKLQEKLIISQLNISRWVARTADKKATKTVENKYHTSQVGLFHKEIVGRQHLKDIDDALLNLRKFHNTNTLPWGENGDRILPVTNFDNYKNEMEKLMNVYNDNVQKFIVIYPTLKEQAKTILNGLYNEDDYPEDISSKFGVRIKYFPIPNPKDFRINLSDEDMEAISGNLQSTLSARLEDAVDDVWVRIKNVLERMIERLKDPDNSFKESLVTNVSDLVRLIPFLNFDNDPKLESVCNEMKALLQDPNILRNNQKIRKITCKKANGILESIQTFGVLGKRKLSL